MSYTVEQKAQYVNAREKLNPQAQARKSLGKYYLSQNQGYRLVDFQQNKIIPALESVAAGTLNRLMIWLPPGHAKSDIATRNFVPWWMGKHPGKNVMVLSYSADLAARDFGAAIKSRLTSTSHLSCFPDTRLTKDSRSNNMLKTIAGGTFYAAGFDGSLAGKRVDLMGIDDPIKNQDEADSEAREAFLFQIYETVVKARLRPGGAIIMSLTRWAIRDLAARIVEAEGELGEGGDWLVLKLPAEDEEGNYLWESHYGKKHYDDAKFNRDGSLKESWYSLWQQEPGMSNQYLFREDWLQWHDGHIPPGKFNSYLLVDPASSKDRKSDYTAMWILLAGPEGRLFVVDGVLDRLDPGERASEFLRLCRRWNPRKIMYEEYGLLNDTYYLRRQMEAMDFTVYPTPVGRSGSRHNLSKHERIKQIVPWFREGRIYLQKKIERKNSTGQIVNLSQRFVDQEYKLYKGPGSIPHEDQLDCLARIMDVEEQGGFHFAEPETQSEEQYSGPPAGVSWMGVY